MTKNDVPYILKAHAERFALSVGQKVNPNSVYYNFSGMKFIDASVEGASLMIMVDSVLRSLTENDAEAVEPKAVYFKAQDVLVALGKSPSQDIIDAWIELSKTQNVIGGLLRVIKKRLPKPLRRAINKERVWVSVSRTIDDGSERQKGNYYHKDLLPWFVLSIRSGFYAKLGVGFYRALNEVTGGPNPLVSPW